MGREPREITALIANLNSITDTVTVGDSMQWFANSLVERAFNSESGPGNTRVQRSHSLQQGLSAHGERVCCNPDVR